MQGQNKSNGQGPPQKPTILIVDDQPDNLELLVQILKDAGYDTRPTLNAQVALGAVEYTHPDLIILDIRMPEMDGFEVCKQLKAVPQSRHIPVIFISSLDDIDEKIKAFQAGGVDYISRPFQIPEVLARVATHLELARMRNKMETLVRERTTALESKTRKLAQEITTHQATAAQLRQSEENYRFLVENQNDLILKTDARHRLIFASPNVYRTFAKTEDELIGKQIAELFEADNRPVLRQALAALATPPYHVTYQGRTRTQQGWRWFDWSAKARLDTQGKIIDVVSVGRDITKAKEAETALKASEKKFRQLAENISGVFWIYAPDLSEIYYISPAYEQIWGRSCRSLYQSPDSWLAPVIPADRQKILSAWPTKFDNNVKHNPTVDYRIKRPDGTLRWIRHRAFPIFNSEGEVYRVAGIAEDITETVELETKLRQAYKMEAIGTLAGGIAHEFNNVLGIIIGNTELVLDDTAADSLNQKYLREILKASLRGRDVVKQLLNFSRKSAIERIPVDLGQNIKETLQLVKASLPATIEIETQIDAHVHTVVADTAQISQLMLNLCNNASQAMADNGGKLQITLNNTVLDSAEAQKLGMPCGDYVKLCVRDNGHGIKAEILDKIFDPYFTTQKFGQGSGMGLAIVHGIVGAHQGAITVQSMVNQGTQFNIYLPASQCVPAPAVAHSQVVLTGNETILFVDDEVSVTRIAETILNRLGYKVCVENDPAKALQRFKVDPDAFDLIITDMTMPHMTGDQLAVEILKIKKEMPIILCTGHSDRIDKAKARALGIRQYVEKPFQKNTIATIIRLVLDNTEDDQHDTRTISTPDHQPSQMTGN